MCCDFDALGFLHVVCVEVGGEFEGVGFWKKEFIIFILSEESRFNIEVPFLFLFSIPCFPMTFLWIWLAPWFVPTFAFMSCPMITCWLGGVLPNNVASLVLKHLYSLLSTGW
jgi:hypothetical protein